MNSPIALCMKGVVGVALGIISFWYQMCDNKIIVSKEEQNTYV